MDSSHAQLVKGGSIEGRASAELNARRRSFGNRHDICSHISSRKHPATNRSCKLGVTMRTPRTDPTSLNQSGGGGACGSTISTPPATEMASKGSAALAYTCATAQSKASYISKTRCVRWQHALRTATYLEHIVRMIGMYTNLHPTPRVATRRQRACLLT